MIVVESAIFVEGITAQEIFDFLLGATDESYRRWWPGIHLHLHALERYENHIGYSTWTSTLADVACE